MTVEELNELPEHEASDALKACCGASRWVEQMIEARPFESREGVFEKGEALWTAAEPSDWMEAFAHHPRIGERTAAPAQSALAARWSGGEQAAVATASDSVQDELAAVNQEYETRFGHIYIVCASGKPAEELLAIARQRLTNDPDTELRVAAREQGKITQLRLRKLLEVNS